MGWSNIVSEPMFAQLLASYTAIDATVKNPRLNSKGLVEFNRPHTVDFDMWRHVLEPICGERGDKLDQVKAVTGMRAMSNIAAIGAKVFQPTADQWRSMGDVEMRFPCAEYRQPFPTLIIDIPVDVEITGTYGTDVGPEHTRGLKATNRVESLVITHDTMAKTVYACAVQEMIGPGRPMMPLKFRMPDDQVSMEDAILAEFKAGREYRPDETMLPVHQVQRLFRPALNACLFLANFGAKSLGRTSPTLYEQLMDTSRKKKASDKVRENARLSARLMPEVFAIDQHIDLREATAGPGEHGDGGGTVSPHWRRAHWASQPHGPQHSLRKLVFRRASFINRERFAGSGLDSSTTYTA